MAAHARTTRPASAPQVAARQEQEQATVGGLLASIDSLLQHGGLVEAPMAPEAAARQVRGVLAARRQELQVRTDALQRQAQRLEKERRWTDALLGGERTDERFDASAVEARRQRVERDLGDVRRRLEEASLQLGAVDADTRRLAEHPEAARAIGLAHSNGPSLPAAFQGWLEAGSTPSDSEREEALRVACAVPMERLRGELNSTWVDDDTVLSTPAPLRERRESEPTVPMRPASKLQPRSRAGQIVRWLIALFLLLLVVGAVFVATFSLMLYVLQVLGR